MRAICVDDEILLLKSLKKAVESSPDITYVEAFDDELEALSRAESTDFDIAFLDIRLHSESGLALAEKLMRINPAIHIIFCTGYREYACDAFALHASGYLVKPVGKEDVQREIDHILKRGLKRTVLQARCFGSFEVFSDGVPLRFRRTKTKELLAYLIDRKGAVISSQDLAALLWEDREGASGNINYLHQLVSDLKKALKAAGAESVLVSSGQGYRVETSLINCDYYAYLSKDPFAERAFTGEYMSNYSWSEFTCAYLLAEKQSK